MTPSRTGPVLLALLLLAACGGSGGGSAAGGDPTSVKAERAVGGQTVTVESRDGPNRFVPDRVEVAAGGDLSVTLTNSGGAPHDLVVEGVEGAGTGTVDGGEEKTVTFAVPATGTYTFVCTIHPGMDGELVVA